MKPKVAVLLAGYNGKEFILEQVFSLILQESVDIDIYIRVDGHCDIFRTILDNFSINFSNIHIINGDVRSTPSSNFYNLIFNVNYKNYDYFSFSDQDDIWLSDKIIYAISHFNKDTPQGFSSGVNAFYDNGKTSVLSLQKTRKYDYFFQAGGPGCTYILNSSGFKFLRNFLSDNQDLLSVSAHDWLIYYIFRIHGFYWSFGRDTKILYRQHLHNVAGINKGLSAKFKRLIPLFKGWYFKDLEILIRFASNLGKLPIFINPFNLRRSFLSSLVMWLYYWCYFRLVISLHKKR